MAVLNFLTGLIIGKEFVGQSERLSKKILDLAISRVPDHLKEQYASEWPAHFEECPGPLSKLYHAIGCWIVAPRLAFDSISLSEGLTFVKVYLCATTIKTHHRWLRLKIKLLFSFLILSDRLGYRSPRLSQCRRHTSALVQFARWEGGIATCFALFARAGLRLGDQAQVAEKARTYAICYGLSYGAFCANECINRQSDVAVLRKTFGFNITIKPRTKSPEFERLVKSGKECHETFTSLMHAMKKVEALLKEMEGPLSAEELEKLLAIKSQLSLV